MLEVDALGVNERRVMKGVNVYEPLDRHSS